MSDPALDASSFVARGRATRGRRMILSVEGLSGSVPSAAARSLALCAALVLLVTPLAGADNVTSKVVPAGSVPSYTGHHNQYFPYSPTGSLCLWAEGCTHLGVDIWASAGSPIYPFAAGYVAAKVDNHASFGNAVMLRHPALGPGGQDAYSIYLHMQAPSALSVGAFVGEQTSLGGIGMTGSANGINHTHFEIRYFSSWTWTWTFGATTYGNIYCRGDCRLDPAIPANWDDPENTGLSTAKRPLSGDWNGDGVDAVWTYSGGQWTIPASDDPPSGRTFTFGLPGDLPIVGDFNGDGAEDFGVLRLGDSPSKFHFDLNRNGAEDWVIPLNAQYPQDLPIAGDWDGDGATDVGAWDSNTEIFYLFKITSPSTISNYASFQMGIPGDVPIAGNWDGIGPTEVGVFRRGDVTVNTLTNNFYFRKSDGSVVSLATMPGGNPSGWGNLGDVPVVGDWNNDGYDTIGLYRPSTQEAFLSDLPKFTAPCTYALAQPGATIGAGAQTGLSFSVTTTAGCGWTATTATTWITITSGTGTGNGAVTYSVQSNPGATQRPGTISVQGNTYSVTQLGSSAGTNVALGKPVTITTNGADDPCTGCGHEAADVTDGSLAYTNVSSDVQDGVVGYQNVDYSQLMELNVTINLGGPHLISQIRYNMGNVLFADTWGADLMITPLGTTSPVPGGPSTGAWTQQTGSFTASSVTITLRKTRTTNATDWLFVGEVEIYGSPIGCSYGVPAGATIGAGAQTGLSFSVTAGAGCGWTATTATSWITLTSGAGTGNGTVTYSVAANSGTSLRSGAISVGGQTFSVNQQGAGAQGVVFQDSMESGVNGWSGGWTQTTTSSHSPTHSWTDSPGGNYGDNANNSMWSPVINLSGLSSASLKFWHRFDLAAGDGGNVWVWQTGTSTWTQLGGFNGTAPDWRQDSFGLNAFLGQSIQVVFQLWSNATGTADGWYVDDVSVGPGCSPGGAFDSDSDGIPDTVEATEGTNACTRDNDVFTSARLFSMQQYRDFLGREGDAFGISYWTSAISGGTSRATVTKSFFDSAEFQGAIAPVTRLYFAYFNRIPDKPGLDYWIAQYGAGTSLNTISQAFAGSAEFVGTYGNLNNTEFVTLVYQNVLGRAPDAAGLAYWTGQLDGGFMTRGQVMVGFSESVEYQQSSYNRVFVTMVYYGMLRRVPEQAGFGYWVAQLAGGSSALNLINGFLVALEYRGRFLP